jgi:hypothetical protein
VTVVSGRLGVSGKLCEARWMRNDGHLVSSSCDLLAEPRGLDKLAARMKPDAIEDAFANSDVDSMPVYLREVVRADERYSGGPTGLVLQRIEDSCFMRVGIFEFHSWFTPLGRQGKTYQDKDLWYRAQIKSFNDCATQACK